MPVTIVCSHLPHVYRSQLLAFTLRLQVTSAHLSHLRAFTPRLQVTTARIYPTFTCRICSHLPCVYRSLLRICHICSHLPCVYRSLLRICHICAHLPHVYRSHLLAFTLRLQVTSARIYPTFAGHICSHLPHVTCSHLPHVYRSQVITDIWRPISQSEFQSTALIQSGHTYTQYYQGYHVATYSPVTHINSIIRDTMLCDSRSATSACRYTQQSS